MTDHNTSTTPKVYPTSSSEVARMLGLDKAAEEHAAALDVAHASESVVPESAAPSNLPTPAAVSAGASHSAPEKTADANSVSTDLKAEEVDEKKSAVATVLKRAAPYLLVFAIGLVGYYFFLSDSPLDLSRIFSVKKEVTQPLTAKDTELMALQKDSATMASYRAWISQFYFDISDSAIIDPNADNSGNGLSNFQKYLLNLNPKTYDTLNLGMADSQALAQGINPQTGAKLTAKQQEIIDKYFDLEIILNRLAVEGLHRYGSVAGTSVTNNQQSGASVQREAPRGGSTTVARAAEKVTVGGYDNPSGGGTESENLNLSTPGRLEIPSLKIDVPIIWTRDPKDFEKDLQLGVVHYPGTAVPGQIGTTYISGHSSNYAWAKGNYNKVFSTLGDLPDNTSFIVTVVQKNGKDARFHYVVTGRKEFSPTDPEQFKNSGESVVALSTCWPVGSTKSRLVVFAKLTQTEN